MQSLTNFQNSKDTGCVVGLDLPKEQNMKSRLKKMNFYCTGSIYVIFQDDSHEA